MMLRRQGDQNGVILIALVWVLVALSVLALSFARESFVEVSAARNDRDLAEAYYTARAGMAATIYQLWGKRYAPRVRQLELPEEPDAVDLGKVTGHFGTGTYEVEIQDESGKINLNFVPEELLRSALEVAGIEKTDADVIADSIMDWRDIDSAHHLNGAEDDYYQGLEPPYKAKNGRFDTVEELLLVRGVTRDYFFGRQERDPEGNIVQRYGLSRYFTVYTTSNRINVNYAPLEVLLAVPGMPPEAARVIYERRLARPFADLGEVTNELPTALGPTTLPFLTVTPTGFYTLTAAGQKDGSKVKRVIRAVINLDVREATKYRILYWNENIANL